MSTVLGSTVYQNIADSATNAGIGLGTFPISLASAAPLFVNAAAGNFYLAAGSQALNSAVELLAGPTRHGNQGDLAASAAIADHRPGIRRLGPASCRHRSRARPRLLARVRTSSSIAAPSTASTSRRRPRTSAWSSRPPIPSGGVAPQWVADDDTVPAGQTLSAFAVQLIDSGTGIDNTTVSAADITVYRSDNPTTPLVDGTDYTYSYDPTDHIIYLAAVAGVWTGGYTYTIDVNNSAATGIKDIAGYALAANRSNGTTSFTVTLVADANFSNAPGYPIAWHFITDNLYLGTVAPKPQATFVPSLTPANGDNGVDFSDVTLIQGQTTTVPMYRHEHDREAGLPERLDRFRRRRDLHGRRSSRRGPRRQSGLEPSDHHRPGVGDGRHHLGPIPRVYDRRFGAQRHGPRRRSGGLR